MLSLKPHHKAIRAFFQELETLQQAGACHEGAVAPAFAAVLRACAGLIPGLKLVEQYAIPREGRRPIRVDGAILDRFDLRLGVWEAKDHQDHLRQEITKKFAEGYPKDNILFQTPDRLVLWQNGAEVFDARIDAQAPEALVDGLQLFFGYQPPAYDQWQAAVAGFKERVQELGMALLNVIAEERRKNPAFIAAFAAFLQLCRDSMNPQLSEAAIEEMLIQHVLTERIFRKVFNHSDFVQRNVIAREIEQVMQALTARSFSREAFLQKLDYFYQAIEKTAASISHYAEKQSFLNTVYEQFFQGFAVKTADTHGIVYTPQPLVDFMVRSVNELLQREFGRSLSAESVHILDPFVGTGNFMVRILRELTPEAIQQKYHHELHCNEIMLLPYYIASLNIEQAFFELTGAYQPFTGICLVDTFELAEDRQHEFGFLTPENTERVNRQKGAPIFVIIGNPPYNAGQIHENDHNKNRKYRIVDRWVAERYVAGSQATLRNALYDPYVKAFAWATERLRHQSQGIVAFVTNNGFLEGIAFDGMRKCLSDEFTSIYHINLKGNARTSGERRRQEGGNIFDDSIRVGVGITFLIKNQKFLNKPANIWIYFIDDYLKKKDKNELLINTDNLFDLPLVQAEVNQANYWLNKGMETDYETLIAIGSKEQKSTQSESENVIFKIFSNGTKSNNDAYIYNYNRANLENIARNMVENFNSERDRWIRNGKPEVIEDFLKVNEKVLKWIRNTKRSLLRSHEAQFESNKIRSSLYRPFDKRFCYFERIFNEELYLFPKIFPDELSEKENKVICVSGVGSNKPFHTLITCAIPCLDLLEKTQCFPFYTYTKDGLNRSENVTDWVLEKFRQHYQDHQISKWAIFYYVYALLQHPDYRQKYAANLRRELPRIPLAPDFWAFSQSGQQLAAIHVDYEQQSEFPLTRIYAPNQPHDWTIQKMRLNKDKMAILYNEWLTLSGIPPEAFAYRLGNRSALEWVIEQYQVKTDSRSGILNDPNDYENPQTIIKLIGQVVHVSVETVKIIETLPGFGTLST